MAPRRSLTQRLNPARPIEWTYPLNRDLVLKPAISAPLPGWTGGTTLRDMVRGAKNPNDGTLTGGVTWGSGQYGQCLKFDGTANQRVVVPAAAAFANSKTIDFWIQRQSDNSGCVYDKTDGNAVNGGWDVRINFGSTGDLFCVREFSGANGSLSSSAGVLALNTWHHVAIIWDGTTNHAGWHIYVDGIDVTSSGADGAGTSTDAGEDIYLGAGRSGMGGTTPFIGLLADFSAFSSVLSAAEVRTIYDQDKRNNPDRWNWLPQRRFVPGGAPPASSSMLLRRRRVMLCS